MNSINFKGARGVGKRDTGVVSMSKAQQEPVAFAVCWSNSSLCEYWFPLKS